MELVMKRLGHFSYLFFLLSVFCMVFTGCAKKTIINGIEEKESNEILVILASRDIDADKVLAENKSGGGGSKEVLYNIAVSDKDTIKAMAILNQYGFPKKKGVTLLDIFGKAGLVPSEQEEKIRYRAGKEEEIASIIRKIDGVLDANVQLSFPKEDNMRTEIPEDEKVTASVYVKHQGVLDDPNTHLSTKIKRLVAASINGLKYEDVTVISDRARFSGIQPFQQGGSAQEKEYVKVWSIVISKESVGTFRTLFFSLCFFSLVLLFVIGWLVWKILPCMSSKEGRHELFSLSHLNIIFKNQKEQKDDKTEDSDEENEEDDDEEDDEDEEDEEEDEDEDEDEV
jgi:type III secretion protein J